MLCWLNMKNEKNVTMDSSFQVKQVTETRKTENNYIQEKN